jgi:class 3 adenylate cyclase
VFADPKPTSLSGEPPSPEALRDVMTRYFDAMQVALARHGATIEKFIGDAVMAVYGLPVRHEDDAIRAIRAAAEMQAVLPDLNAAFRAEWGLELHNHIGVNTGEVIAGDATTGQRLVTGDAVNTAARLEQAAGPGEIIIGDLTYRLARDEIEVEEIAPLSLKGKAEPVPAYRFVALREFTPESDAASSPFVGREREMGRLTQSLDDVRRRSGAAVLTVVGDAGVGKSRRIGRCQGQHARRRPRRRGTRSSGGGRSRRVGDGPDRWRVPGGGAVLGDPQAAGSARARAAARDDRR